MCARAGGAACARAIVLSRAYGWCVVLVTGARLCASLSRCLGLLKAFPPEGCDDATVPFNLDFEDVTSTRVLQVAVQMPVSRCLPVCRCGKVCAPSQAGGGAGPLKLGGIMPLWAKFKLALYRRDRPDDARASVALSGSPRVPAPAQAGKGSFKVGAPRHRNRGHQLPGPAGEAGASRGQAAGPLLGRGGQQAAGVAGPLQFKR